jgi:hypothetical protein
MEKSTEILPLARRQKLYESPEVQSEFLVRFRDEEDDAS